MKLLNIFKDKKERQAYAYIISLTIPMVIQNIFNSAVNSADVLMLNSVGQDAISAVSLATQYSNILTNIFMGLGSGIAMLSSQYWGKKDIKVIQKVQGIGFRFSLISALLFALPSLLCPELMMRIYTNESQLIKLGAEYLRIVGISHIFWGMSETFIYTMRSIERVKLCSYINIFALLLNVGLNAVFIYGLFGAPQLGVMGVALATTISRIVQFIICLVVSHFSNDIKLDVKSIFEKNTLKLLQRKI